MTHVHCIDFSYAEGEIFKTSKKPAHDGLSHAEEEMVIEMDRTGM